MQTMLKGFLLLAGLIIIPSWGFATPIYYQADLTPLNGSGVNGTANLVLNGNSLSVTIDASGLEPGQPHPQHIHGLFSGGTTGTPANSTLPTTADDTDHDGYVELNEAASSYGPVIIPLTSPPGGALADFPVATAAGTIHFSQVYDLTDSTTFGGTGYNAADLMPLTLREIVLHGMTVPAGAGAGTTGEVDGTAGYKAALPVAAGEIVRAAVPVPPTAWLMGVGLIGLVIRRQGRGTA